MNYVNYTLPLIKTFPYRHFLKKCVDSRKLTSIKLGNYLKWHRLAYRSSDSIRSLKDSWNQNNVVCVGGGPSLNETNLKLLNGQKVIGVNAAYKLMNQIEPSDFILMVQDLFRFKAMEKDLEQFKYRFFVGNAHFHEDEDPPAWLDPKNKNHCVFMPVTEWEWRNHSISLETATSDGFSNDPSKNVFFGYSVIFSAIQLATYLGAKKIVCIGIDMDYSGKVSYFPAVKNLWPEFSYEQHAKGMFITMRKALELCGVDLINATPGGKVDVLKRMDLEEALG